MRGIFESVQVEYFSSTYAQKVCEWVLVYYKKYEESPYDHIKDIYIANRKKLKDEESELIETLLDDISREYQKDDDINVDYLIDQSIEYFKKREIEITNIKLKECLIREDIVEAEKLILDFRKVGKLASKWINPFDVEKIEQIFEERERTFFKFPGAMGEFLGHHDRGWLVGITGSFKKGKSWLMQEYGIIGMLSRLRVAFFSLEMTEKTMLERIYKRLTGFSSIDDKEVLYPIFDCRLNQSNDCRMKERACSVGIVKKYGDPPPDFQYSPIAYKPCSYCRNHEQKKYDMTTWWETIKQQKFTVSNVLNRMDALRDVYGHLFKVRIHPKYGASVSDIERDLDILERVHNFIPDIIIIDYADILKSDNNQLTGTQKEDDIWINLARLAGERHCLVITGTQATKESMDAKQLTHKHTARWVGKLGHIDIMLAMSQLEEEKKQGIMRLGIMMHRHDDFIESNEVVLLQQIATGQPHLDSYAKFSKK